MIEVTVRVEPSPRMLARRVGDLEAAIRRAAQETAQEAGKHGVRLLRGATRTWQHKPNFDVATEAAGDEITVLVGTSDRVFHFVDLGTRPHTIYPRHARVLRFQSGYRAKTRPGSLVSRAGGKFGPYVFAHSVRHPGTEARRFSEVAAKDVRRFAQHEFSRRIKRAIRGT